jgi:hypothetical protein
MSQRTQAYWLRRSTGAADRFTRLVRQLRITPDELRLLKDIRRLKEKEASP